MTLPQNCYEAESVGGAERNWLQDCGLIDTTWPNTTGHCLRESLRTHIP